jgi:hypothetical protein
MQSVMRSCVFSKVFAPRLHRVGDGSVYGTVNASVAGIVSASVSVFVIVGCVNGFTSFLSIGTMVHLFHFEKQLKYLLKG